MFHSRLGAICLLLSLPPGVAVAVNFGDDHQFELAGKLTLTTDATLHGLRQSDGMVTPQLSLKLQGESPFFAGIWISEVKPDAFSERSTEIDYFLGYQGSLGEQVALSAVVTKYTYSADARFYDDDWLELSLHATLFERVSLSYARGRDWFYDNTSSDAVSATVLYPAPWRLTGDIAVGYVDLTEALGIDYSYFEFGLARSFQRFALRIAYTGTSDNANARLGNDPEDKLYLSLSLLF